MSTPPPLSSRSRRLVAPDKLRQRAFLFHHLLRLPRIVDHCLNLAAMPDDPLVLEQPLDVALGEAGNLVEIKPAKSGAKVLALGEDGSPAQPGLETLQAQLLKQPPIVADREAPFSIVIAEKLWSRGAPRAPRLPVLTYKCCAQSFLLWISSSAHDGDLPYLILAILWPLRNVY